MLIKLDGIQDIKEQLTPPAGSYNLVVLKADEHTTEKEGRKNKSIRLILGIEGEDKEYANLFDYMALPSEGDDKEKLEFKLLMIKRRLFWLDCMEAVETGELDTSELVGSRSIQAIPVMEDPPTPENKNRTDGRSVAWPKIPTED